MGLNCRSYSVKIFLDFMVQTSYAVNSKDSMSGHFHSDFKTHLIVLCPCPLAAAFLSLTSFLFEEGASVMAIGWSCWSTIRDANVLQVAYWPHPAETGEAVLQNGHTREAAKSGPSANPGSSRDFPGNHSIFVLSDHLWMPQKELNKPFISSAIVSQSMQMWKSLSNSPLDNRLCSALNSLWNLEWSRVGTGC